MASTARKYFTVNGSEVDFTPTSFPTWLNIFCDLQKAYPDSVVECGWVYTDGSTMCMGKTAPKNTENLDHLPPVSDENRSGECDEPGDSNSLHDEYLAEKHFVRSEMTF